MSVPDIDFRNIRAFNGSRHQGFEELCCQLAALEALPSGSTFHRKGQGGDAGLECFLRLEDGKEIGWQAKYLFRWNDSCALQLDKSIKTAIEKHPNLTEYVVCLPFDLSDSRSGRGKTAREKWDGWHAKWTKRAADEKRDVTVKLWGKSELCSRLVRDDPSFAGRALYWFDIETFTSCWFQEQFERAKVSLGSRYNPETNVDLPIRQNFVALARHPELQKEIDRWCSSVAEKGRSAIRAIQETRTDAAQAQADVLETAVDVLTAALDSDPIASDQPYPTDAWRSAASACLELACEALRWSLDLPLSVPGSLGIEPERWTRHALHELIVTLQDIDEALSSDRWRIANANSVLLKGPAGIGKSHLLADVVCHHLQENRPAVLLLGAAFVDDELWPQIRDRLDRPPTEQFRHFLGALDSAAEAAGVRALLCVDALNERHGIDVWPERLPAFIRDIESFARICLVLSCRSTYVPYVIPDVLEDDRLVHVEHKGFAGSGGRAADTYLDMRGIMRPGSPNMVSEFENPLFLKTCCDALAVWGKTEFPRGLRGVTSIFEFYNKSVAECLTHRMKLDRLQNIVPTGISGFARLLIDARSGYVDRATAVKFFESILPSGGSLEKSLLSQLESEGLLTIEAVPEDDGSSAESVRFTFERYSDHTIASRLLEDYLDKNDVQNAFRIGRPLHDFVFGPKSYERAGIIEALAIQLPEASRIEVLDVANESSPLVCRAFVDSLLWRDQSFFSQRTFELAQEVMDEEEFSDVLVSIGTEPSNEFNASFLHQRLMGMSMPERDACWSVYLATRGFDGPIETLISWAIRGDHERIDDERAKLAAVMLTWFFSTSNREIRDKATKALASILMQRLALGVRLLEQFDNVNDLYVLERLLGACYGAALQGGQDDGLAELAEAVFNKLFSEDAPPLNALLRDHGLHLLEYVAHRRLLVHAIDMKRARPPYNSPWPIEAVPDEIIQRYTERRQGRETLDRIADSTVNRGDFARYTVTQVVRSWSPAELGAKALPTESDLVESWQEEFTETATEEQLEACDVYTKAAIACISVNHRESEIHAIAALV